MKVCSKLVKRISYDITVHFFGINEEVVKVVKIEKIAKIMKM